MRNADYKAQLFEMIISGKGLQYVMDACSELLNNPFVFGNQSLQLVSKSSSCNCFPEIFGWLEDKYGENLRFAQEANRAGYFRDIYASDLPVYGKVSGISTNWFAARVRLKNQILGSILVADIQTPFTENYQELLPLVCQTIAFALQQSGNYDNGYQKYAPLLIELLEGDSERYLNIEAIREQFKLLGQVFPNKIRVLIVRPVKSEQQIVNPIILDAQLSSQFPLSLGVIYKNDCVRILNDTFSQETIEDRLQKYVNISDAECGISRVFESSHSIRDAYLQADAAIRLSKNRKNSVLIHFNEVAGPYLLEQAAIANNMTEKGLIMPEISVLLSSKEGTERVRDLAAYLSCGRNVTRAGELRCIHKNSMYYRLERITELTKLNLNDDDTCVQLTLTLSLLGILPFQNTAI